MPAEHGTTTCIVTSPRRPMWPKPVISIRSRSKPETASVRLTGPVPVTGHQRRTGPALQPRGRQTNRFRPVICANRVQTRAQDHRQPITMCSLTRVAMSTGILMVAGRRMTARVGTMCHQQVDLTRPGLQAQTAPQLIAAAHQHGNRQVRRASPAPTINRIPVMAANPVWIARTTPGSALRLEAVNTARKDPNGAVEGEGDKGWKSRRSACGRLLFGNPSADRYLADVQHFRGLVVEELLFAIAPVFQQIGERITVGIQNVSG